MISMKTIYGIGAWLMLVSIGANLYNFIGSWAIMNNASRIAFIFGNLLFQTLIMVSFAVMFKMMPTMQTTTATVDDKDIQEYLSTLSDKYKEVKDEQKRK
jgi:hypothetical protein